VPDQSRLSPREYGLALAELERIEGILARMSSSLDDHGHERPAILLENAWRDVLATQHLLDRDAHAVLRMIQHQRALAAPDGQPN